MALKTFAAIDVGSFELAMKIFEISPRAGLREIDDIRHRIDLGTDTYTTGKISNERINELCEVLKEFKEIMRTYKVNAYRAYATSALRETENRLIILDMIKNRTGLDIEVLSNSEQRFLDYKAIASKGEGFQKIIEKGTAIVDIGGGTADIAVISLGGTVVSTSIKVAGDDFDEAIVRYMRKTHNLLIGERTAEDIKIQIGSAYKRPEVVSMDVRGRNLVTGLPKTITVTSDETMDALKEITSQIVEAVHSVLEKTPPELAADVSDRGIVLTGGGSLLYGLEELIEEKTGITTMTAEDPMTAVAIGTGQFVEFLSGKHDED